MKKNIFIIDDNVSSKLNGIGTYIRELSNNLKIIGANVWVVSFNSKTDPFGIYNKNEICKIYL